MLDKSVKNAYYSRCVIFLGIELALGNISNINLFKIKGYYYTIKVRNPYLITRCIVATQNSI